MKKILIIFLAIFMFSPQAFAKSNCDYSEQYELKTKAGAVTAKYSVENSTKQDGEDELGIRTFKISITNVTKDLYVVVKNDFNDEEKTYRYEDSNSGIVTFDWSEFDQITNFTIYVYSSNNTSCANEKYKTLYLATPKFNRFSELMVCSQNPDFNLCQEYVTSNFTEKNFYDQLNVYLNDKDKKDDKKKENDNSSIIDNVIDFVTDYKYFIIGGIIVLASGGFIIYRVRTKKQRELGL